MPEENQEGLESSDGESSLDQTGELNIGETESPEEEVNEDNKEEISAESPTTNDGVGQSANESGDSELDGIFTDLETDIPEELKPRASNVKKKLQGYFTQKNQAISQELESLKQNQITEDLKNDYSILYGWYDKLQKNPVEGLKELASTLGVPIDGLASKGETNVSEPELEPGNLTTREDYVNFTRQEIRKAVEEVREKEVKPLKDSLNGIEGDSVKRENIARGAQAVKDAKALPGFADENGVISKAGHEAITRVLKKEFTGPDAIKNAYHAIIGQESPSKVKELEKQLLNLKKNMRGVSKPPDGHSPKTVITPSSPDDLWDDLSSESLS